MWLFTEDGYFSVMQERTDVQDVLYIRARDEQSLCALRERLVSQVRDTSQGVYIKTGGTDGIMHRGKFWVGTIDAYTGTDYEYRMEIPRELFMAYLTLTVDGINYRNFKDRAHHVWEEAWGLPLANARSSALTEVWGTMASIWPRHTDRPILKLVQVLKEEDDEGTSVSDDED